MKQKDQSGLYSIARDNSLSLDEREKAVMNITSQNILAEIAGDIDEDQYLRIISISRITDSDILNKLNKIQNNRIQSAIDNILKK